MNNTSPQSAGIKKQANSKHRVKLIIHFTLPNPSLIPAHQ